MATPPGAGALRRASSAAGRPFRRRPKELTSEPALLVPAHGSTGLVLVPTGRSTDAGGRSRGSPVTSTTDEAGDVVTLDDLDAPPDPLAHRRAREIATRLAVPRPGRDAPARCGVGELESAPFRGASDDIDLDRTLEVLAEVPFPADEEIVMRERRRPRRSVVLVVDVSGSMKGERLRTAAATVGALVGELRRDRLAVVAFWSQAALLVRLGQPTGALEVLDALLRIPAKGLTNVTFALDVARRQLDGVLPTNARVVLLSDCVHNAGPDPRTVAARLPRLDVLLDAGGESDVPLGRDLARRGRGTMTVVHGHRDVAPALGAIFTR